MGKNDSKTHTKETDLWGLKSLYFMEITFHTLLKKQAKMKMEDQKETNLLQALSVIEYHGIAMCYLTFFHR
jgi:hypothetical protein